MDGQKLGRPLTWMDYWTAAEILLQLPPEPVAHQPQDVPFEALMQVTEYLRSLANVQQESSPPASPPSR